MTHGGRGYADAPPPFFFFIRHPSLLMRIPLAPIPLLSEVVSPDHSSIVIVATALVAILDLVRFVLSQRWKP